MSVLPCSFLLLFLCLHILTEATPQEKTHRPRWPPPSPSPARRGQNHSVRSSGELSTQEGHYCTWQTSGEDPVTLLVNCSTDAEVRYWCRFAGNPSLCSAYGVKSSSYWKQLVGKLKKRQNACEGEKILRAKTCKKGGEGAHMKLTQRGGGGGEKHGEGGRREEKEEERRRFEENRVVNHVDLVQTYCGEGWSSVCAFFIKMFHG